jgi:hypothetical protein
MRRLALEAGPQTQMQKEDKLKSMRLPQACVDRELSFLGQPLEPARNNAGPQPGEQIKKAEVLVPGSAGVSPASFPFEGMGFEAQNQKRRPGGFKSEPPPT